jgi:hypothetical protein
MWPPDFDGTSYTIFISSPLLLLPSWVLLVSGCQRSCKKCLEKNINERLTNEKMRHVNEMCHVYIAFVKAMILLIELGTGLTEICRLRVMKAIWYRVETWDLVLMLGRWRELRQCWITWKNKFLFRLVRPPPKALRVKEPEKYECFEDVAMGGMDGYTWKMITYCKPLEEEPRRWCFCT